MEAIKQFQTKLFKPVDASSLVVFRIGFGLIMMIEVWRYWRYDWIGRFFIEPQFMFKFYGFEWLQAWPGDGMYVHFAVLGISALFITLGLLYRISMVIFTLSFAFIFLLDQGRYLNHFYLVLLVSILMCFLPAHRQYSVDAWLRPKLKSSTIPIWPIWILMAQMEIMLLFAGLVKINTDWLRLQPLKMWLAKREDFPLLGELFVQEWAVAVAAYGIIILHIVGSPLLFWRRTRLTVFVIYGVFHILNHFVFNIGIFPWFTLFATLLFFDPDWPRQFARKLRSIFESTIKSTFNSTIKSRFWSRTERVPANDSDTIGATINNPAVPLSKQRLVFAFFAIWVSTQILIPLRHLLYPGNVSWTEEGHRFAWQMKLRSKRSTADFYLVNTDNRKEAWQVNPRQYLTKRQARTMAGRPDMILQFAHYLEQYWRENYQIHNLEIMATVSVSLNGRIPAMLIDPERDLLKIERNLKTADWILPLNEPLR